MFDKIKEYLKKSPLDYDFTDNSYNFESLFLESIRSNFAGWYIPDDIPKQLEFILSLCRPGNHDKVLDVACGHGKHSIEASKKGYNVIGIDISDSLIEYLNGLGIGRCTFIKKRMSEISYENEFGLIIVLGNSLSLISQEECVETLGRLYTALRNDGSLFIQLDNKRLFVDHEANTKKWNFHQNRWLNLSEHYYDSKRDLEITRDIGFDVTNQTINNYILVKKLYDNDKIVKMLADAGFKDIQCWGDWDKSSFNEGAPTMLLMAIK